MGFSEVGGNGSVQVSTWIPEAEGGETEEGIPADDVWGRAQKAGRLSSKAVGLRPLRTGRAYRGLDTQPPSGGGDFTVTVRFSTQNEKTAAQNAFQTAQGLEVTFNVRIRRDEPGQIQIEWPS